LESWHVVVNVNHKASDESDAAHFDSEAHVEFSDGYDEATITVNLFNLSDEAALEEACAHEVMHIAARELDRLAHYAVPRRLRKHVEQAVDRCVTRVSRALAKMRG
jgi:hypothetical protein